ncbi:phosphotransferase [Streptomyces sp. NPDC048516]|uniref:phosphotransferase n=1 Tax=Streptomyces sp. NPDC048516 TaxID=3365565 RepID=UPI0037110391
MTGSDTDVRAAARWRSQRPTLPDPETRREDRATSWRLRTHPVPTEIDWATAHGDCHFANLTMSGPTLLDFEGFGLAPVGYDPALLYAYSLLAPQTAARIRAEFPIPDSPAGHTALLVVAADLLQSASRGDHPELAEPLRTLVTSIAR